MLNISLPDSLKDFVEEQAALGGYSPPSDYVRSLLRQAQDHKDRAECEGKLLVALDGEAAEMGKAGTRCVSACARRQPKGEPPRRRPSAAKSDLDEQVRYIAQDRDRLSSFPEIGRRRELLHPDLRDVRSWPIPHFAKHVM